MQHSGTERVRDPQHKIALRPEPRRPGGGGVNVESGIRRLGGQFDRLIYALGGPTGGLTAAAEAEGIIGRVSVLPHHAQRTFTID